jgi:type II secretory pathway pseudopilin PulG
VSTATLRSRCHASELRVASASWPRSSRDMRGNAEAGYSLVELLFVAGIMATLSAVAVPQWLATIDTYRAIGATRYLSTRLYRARSEAVMRSADVAVRFVDSGAGYMFAVYIDGNRNGILAADVEQGIDRQIAAGERLGDSFSGVEFGALPGLPPVEAGATAPGDDPIRLGPGNSVTFTAIGTATPGSLYIRSGRGAQYVIRIFGQTGKTRILQFNVRAWKWMAL